MTNIFTAFLLTSLIGTTLALVIVLLKPFTKKIFSASWHYYIWLCAIIVMMLPLKINLPASEQKQVFVESEMSQIVEFENIAGWLIINPIISKIINEKMIPLKFLFMLKIKNF